MLSGSLVTTAWRVLGLRMGETAFRYGGQLKYIQKAVTVSREWVIFSLRFGQGLTTCRRKIAVLYETLQTVRKIETTRKTET
jgi:hypothetical protein